MADMSATARRRPRPADRVGRQRNRPSAGFTAHADVREPRKSFGAGSVGAHVVGAPAASELFAAGGQFADQVVKCFVVPAGVELRRRDHHRELSPRVPSLIGLLGWSTSTTANRVQPGRQEAVRATVASASAEAVRLAGAVRQAATHIVWACWSSIPPALCVAIIARWACQSRATAGHHRVGERGESLPTRLADRAGHVGTAAANRLIGGGCSGHAPDVARSGQPGALPDRLGRGLADPPVQQRGAGLHVLAPVPGRDPRGADLALCDGDLGRARIGWGDPPPTATPAVTRHAPVRAGACGGAHSRTSAPSGLAASPQSGDAISRTGRGFRSMARIVGMSGPTLGGAVPGG
jgi:hypothetical protein